MAVATQVYVKPGDLCAAAVSGLVSFHLHSPDLDRNWCKEFARYILGGIRDMHINQNQKKLYQ